MKIVLDTNVFISGIFWKGPPHQIIKLAEEKRVKIYATLEILEELFGVLKRKKFDYLFKEIKTSREIIFQEILELVKTCICKVKVWVIKKDLPDNKFLACALCCGASFIISGDRHLLKLKKFKGIYIVSSKEFLKILKK